MSSIDPALLYYGKMIAELAAQSKPEQKREWRNTEPGVLALLGTRFRIEHRPAKCKCCGDFAVYDDQRLHGRTAQLAHAKQICEQMQEDLEEIGAE